MDRPLKVIISGGGTGGHVYPAIAIADAIKSLQPAADILFVGAQGKMEMEKVPEAGYPIEGLWISGLQRKLTADNLLFPFKLISSLLKARGIIGRFKPDVVVGVGGYASGPIMKAANRAGIPTIIQEQNGYAGLTNKLLAQQALRVCVAYPGMERYFPAQKLQFTGNPVRRDILSLQGLREPAAAHFGLAHDRPTLLVIGGSLGALTLNESMAAGVDRLLAAGVQVIWQTGKFYYERYAAQFGNRQAEGLLLLPFLSRMDYAYACSDVVVSRAGALSISELCLAAKPSILVPSPNVAEDHQTKNAQALLGEDAALLVRDVEAREQLVDVALSLLQDPARQQQLSEAIARLGKPDAALDIARVVLQAAGR